MKQAKFSENQTFLNSWYAYDVRVSGSKKCYFFGKFGQLCFLKTPVLIFNHLPYYRRVMRFIRVTIIISVEEFQPSILLMVLHIFQTLTIVAVHFLQRSFATHLRIPVTVKQTSYQCSFIFIATSISQKLKQPHLRNGNFFGATCLEQLTLFNNYFLVTKSFSNKILLQDKYLFRRATASGQLILQDK